MQTWKKAVPTASEQRELKKDALLRQAAFAFRTNGYHGTSLTDIAEALGIKKPTLYYYVKNKQDLLYECHIAASVQALDSVCTDETLSSLERVCRTIADYVTITISEESYSVIILEEKSLKPDLLAEVIKCRDEFQNKVVDQIRAGISDGSISPCDPKFAAFCVFGTANWITKWYRKDGSWTIEDIATGVASFTRGALSKDPVPPGSAKLFNAMSTG